MSNRQNYVTVGTTRPIFVPRDDGSPQAVRPGEDYFLVKIHSAQAAFTGSIWEKVERLLVTSRVNLNHPLLGNEGVRAIQRSREVKKGRAEQLGLTPNLISLVPASMTHVSIGIEYILDKQNRLAMMGGLINDDSFVTALSLAPGAATVAKTLGGLAQKIIQTFIPAEDQEPILNFAGDFNLSTEGLKDGYHVILGTRDERNPIPDPLPALKVREDGLTVDGQRVTQLSYVVLDVRRSPARTREMNDGAPWEAKLSEAEGVAEYVAGDPFAKEEQRREAWEKCKRLIFEARALLLADYNYLKKEAEAICKAAYDRCVKAIVGGEGKRHEGDLVLSGAGWQPDWRADRAFLGISPDEDLVATLDTYAEQVTQARQILKQVG